MSARDDLIGYFGGELEAQLEAAAASRALTFHAATPQISELVATHAVDDVLRRLAERELLSIALAPRSGGYARLDGLPSGQVLEMFDRLRDGGALVMAPVESPALVRAAVAFAEHFALSRDDGVRCELIVTRRGHFTRAHVDDPPGLNLQLAGRKRWWVSTSAAAPEPRAAEMAYVAHPEAGAADGARHLDRSFVMEPGDGLFIPAGCWHQVEALEDSVSVIASFDCGRARWVDAIVERARSLLLQHEDARTPWTLEPRAEARARGHQVIAALRHAFDDLTPAALLHR